MLESDIVGLVKLVNATYQNARPVPPEALPVWNEDLGEFDPADVRAAFTMHRRSGAQFPPTAAELRRLVLELREPTPRFEHAWAAIHKAITRHGYYAEDDAKSALASTPLAWDLVLAMGGWEQVCTGGPEEHPPVDVGVWRAQAEHAWKGLVEQRRTDFAVQDIPSALPRVTEAQRRRSGEPDTLLKPLERAFEERPALPAPEPMSREKLREIALRRVQAAQPNGNGSLSPRTREALIAAIKAGDKIPAKYEPYVAEIKAQLELEAAQS